MQALHTRRRNLTMWPIEATCLASRGAGRACHICWRPGRLDNRQPLSRGLEHHRHRLRGPKEASTPKQAKWAFRAVRAFAPANDSLQHRVMRTAMAIDTISLRGADPDGLRSDRMIDRFRILSTSHSQLMAGSGRTRRGRRDVPDEVVSHSHLGAVLSVLRRGNPARTQKIDRSCSFLCGAGDCCDQHLSFAGQNLRCRASCAAPRTCRAFQAGESFKKRHEDKTKPEEITWASWPNCLEGNTAQHTTTARSDLQARPLTRDLFCILARI